MWPVRGHTNIHSLNNIYFYQHVGVEVVSALSTTSCAVYIYDSLDSKRDNVYSEPHSFIHPFPVDVERKLPEI